MQQVVFNLEREEGSTGTQYTKGFAEGAFLSGVRPEMVQHENGYSRGERLIREGQRRGVSLHDGISILVSKIGGKCVAPLETCHSRGEPAQGLGAGARPSA